MYQDVVMQNSPACPMQCRPNPPSTSLQRGPESEAASISVESPGSLRSIKTNHSNVRAQGNFSNNIYGSKHNIIEKALYLNIEFDPQ